MKKLVLILMALLFLEGITFSQNTLPYFASIQQHRSEKDSLFKTTESPLKPEKRKNFRGLPYFPIDSTFRITALFKRTPRSKPFRMQTTTERLPLYKKFGELTFLFDGKMFRMTVYQNLELIKNPLYKDYLFLPFRDLTSLKETYGGGRYLDLRIPSGTTIELDFNLAYNPYCAYSELYSCPIPPKENDLPIAIKAGEKYEEE